jgi:DDE superfamily endonuclease
VGRLLPLLEQFLKVHLPARHGRQLSEVMAHIPEIKEVLLDGTERPVARPQHKGRRDAHYSARRKRTTVKNVLLTAARRVVLLTPTVPGRRHDKAEADRARVRLKAGHRLLADSGLQGYEAGAAQVCVPHKKPRGRPLHWRHRRANRKLARVRVGVEHVISSVKRLGVLRQTLRMRRRNAADTVMLLGCGLHNFRQAPRALSA